MNSQIQGTAAENIKKTGHGRGRPGTERGICGSRIVLQVHGDELPGGDITGIGRRGSSDVNRPDEESMPWT